MRLHGEGRKVTVDAPVEGNREKTYHDAAWLRAIGEQIGSFPAVRTLEGAGVDRHPGMATRMTWEDVGWIASSTSMKVVVKGVLTAEDAALAADHGAAAIVVSNHGGSQLDGVGGTADVLEECVAGAAGRVEVLVDGGVRRGKDVFRALALGASGASSGAPRRTGLALGGEDGVRRVLEVLQLELAVAMPRAGAAQVGEIGRGLWRGEERVPVVDVSRFVLRPTLQSDAGRAARALKMRAA